MQRLVLLPMVQITCDARSVGFSDGILTVCRAMTLLLQYEGGIFSIVTDHYASGTVDTQVVPTKNCCF